MNAITLKTAGVIALAILAVGMPHAWAKGISFNSLTPSKFISSCEQMGGRVTRVGQGTIKCTLPSGTEVTCSFGNDGTVCTWRGDMTPASRKQLLGDPSPTSINPNTGTTPKAPAAPGTDTVN